MGEADDHRARLRLMGAFDLTDREGAHVALSSRRARALLAYLSLAPNQSGRREHLCGLIWSDRGEEQARASLRQCLFEMRGALSAAGMDLLEVDRERIALRAGRVTSDVEALRAAFQQQDTDRIVAALDPIGRGRLLEDTELGGLFADWLDQTRAGLETAITAGVQDQIAALGAAGCWSQTRRLADVFLRRDPLDEVVVAAAIRAEAATGATAAAHRRFHGLEAALDKALGVPPSALVREALALVDNPRPRDPAPVREPLDAGPSPMDGAPSSNLPAPRDTLIGREDDVTAIQDQLAASPLVTIVGAGGVGKTRVCHEVSGRELGRHDDGVWLVDLAGANHPERARELLAKVLNIKLSVGESAAAALIDGLRRRRCLLVLDNCEHLIAEVAELAEAIVTSAPGVRLLLTSREPLGIDGEQVYRLSPLPAREAVALFSARARACDPGFAIGSSDGEAVAGICRHLDGLPLAIEMAAARAPLLGCANLLDGLDDRFRLLTDGRRTAPPRHRTLHAALDWSYDLLCERDATIFRRLGVFVSDFSLKAASEIAADETFDGYEVMAALSSLVAKSLVTVRNERERTRYALLESTRVYALERLEAAGELDRLRRLHAGWYAALAAPIWQDFISQKSDDELLSRYEPEFDNFHQALDWAYGEGGDAERGHQILSAAAPLWDDRPLERRLAAALPLVGPKTPAKVHASLLASHARVKTRVSPREGLELVDDAIEAVKANIDDPAAVCDVLASKGSALWLAGRFAEARRVADEMKAVMLAQPASRIKAFAIAIDACLRVVEHGPHAGAPLFETAIQSLRAFGADGLANYWQWTSMRLAPPGDPDREIDDWRALLARIMPGQLYADEVRAAVLNELGRRLVRRGTPDDLEEAIRLARMSLKMGSKSLNPRFLLLMAAIAVKSGRPRDAGVIFGKAEALARDLDGPDVAKGEFSAVHALLRAEFDPAELAELREAGAMMANDDAARRAISEESPGPVAGLEPMDAPDLTREYDAGRDIEL